MCIFKFQSYGKSLEMTNKIKPYHCISGAELLRRHSGAESSNVPPTYRIGLPEPDSCHSGNLIRHGNVLCPEIIRDFLQNTFSLKFNRTFPVALEAEKVVLQADSNSSRYASWSIGMGNRLKAFCKTNYGRFFILYAIEPQCPMKALFTGQNSI